MLHQEFAFPMRILTQGSCLISTDGSARNRNNGMLSQKIFNIAGYKPICNAYVQVYASGSVLTLKPGSERIRIRLETKKD